MANHMLLRLLAALSARAALGDDACRIVIADFNLTRSRSGYDAYVTKGDGTYEQHTKSYCDSGHVWAFTGNVDAGTCAAKCHELGCVCYDFYGPAPALTPAPTPVPTGTTVFRHKWDIVADVMGMHGKVGFGKGKYPSDDSLAFVAKNYAMITTGGGCGKGLKGTLEDTTLKMVSQIKAHNPNIIVGMYWRMGTKEVAACTAGTTEWKAHPEWHLKDDNGTDVGGDFDYSNKDVSAFFQNLSLNILKVNLPSGKPVMDYLYLDGAGGNPDAFAPGIGPTRSKQIVKDKFAWIEELQSKADALGHGQNVILNGVDTATWAQTFASLGVAGVMVDHWSVLQFLLRGRATGADFGEFNTTNMNELFDMVRSKALSNMTVQIKGWVGPIVQQPDKYPPAEFRPDLFHPTTPAEKQQVAGERFDSELALFLLVAEDHMYWMYSWFWGFDDWVPGLPDSTIPNNFFPHAKCALGPPKGPPARVADTWKYTREYEHASVFVNLENRSASRVDFKSCPGAVVVL